jgi:hypothetical protein
LREGLHRFGNYTFGEIIYFQIKEKNTEDGAISIHILGACE